MAELVTSPTPLKYRDGRRGPEDYRGPSGRRFATGKSPKAKRFAAVQKAENPQEAHSVRLDYALVLDVIVCSRRLD